MIAWELTISNTEVKVYYFFILMDFFAKVKIFSLIFVKSYPHSSKCFKEKVLSLGRASELSGLSKWDFIEYLSDNGVPVVDYDQDEMKREFETADKLSERLKK